MWPPHNECAWYDIITVTLCVLQDNSEWIFGTYNIKLTLSTTILNACTKKVWKLIEYTTYIFVHVCICTYKCRYVYLDITIYIYVGGGMYVYWFGLMAYKPL